jgi:hypothetical protein
MNCVMDSYPGKDSRYSDLQKSSRRTLGSIKPAVLSVQAPFRGVRRTGCEVDNSPQSGAEIGSEWNCASTPPRRSTVPVVNFVVCTKPAVLLIPTKQ